MFQVFLALSSILVRFIIYFVLTSLDVKGLALPNRSRDRYIHCIKNKKSSVTFNLSKLTSIIENVNTWHMLIYNLIILKCFLFFFWTLLLDARINISESLTLFPLTFCHPLLQILNLGYLRYPWDLLTFPEYTIEPL